MDAARMPATDAPTSDEQVSSMPDGCRLGKYGILAYGIFVAPANSSGECAKPGTKNERIEAEDVEKNEVGALARAFEFSVRQLFADTVTHFCEAKSLWAFWSGVFFRAHEESHDGSGH